MKDRSRQPTTNELDPGNPPGGQFVLRPEVAAFAEMMEEQLRRHDAERGDGYNALTMDDLGPALEFYTGRLIDKAIYATTPAPVIRAAADVANYALFTALNAARANRCADLEIPEGGEGLLAVAGLRGGRCLRHTGAHAATIIVNCLGCPYLPPLKQEVAGA